MNLLIVGASGFVGRYLLDRLGGTGTSTSGENGMLKLDLTSPPSVSGVIGSVNPDVVINASGITNVDLCESKPDLAMNVNGYALMTLAGECRKAGSKLIHISTDYVFNGLKGNYRETDQPDPVNRYGESKLIGEKYADSDRNVIIRISTPYGPNISRRKETFMEFVGHSLKLGRPMKAATDLYTTPTYLEDIARAVEIINEQDLKGIFHLGSTERISRYEFAIRVARTMGYEPERISPCLSRDLPFVARRPPDTSLDTSKIRKYLKITGLEESLRSTLQTL